MLYNLLFYLFLCVISSKVCLCERRITNGRVVTTEKKYVVYLVNSRYSDNQPEAWLCGGVLISTIHVLTAAACLTEVSHIYVIAGYKKYVSSKNIHDDPCTATRKQRIVTVIIPKAYNESTWMRYDVGIGVLEKHYDFFDWSYYIDCSYPPEAISINYYMALESPGDSVLALGWGSALPHKPGMGAVNSEYLMETHSIIGNKTFCQLQFPQDFEYIFLCTYGFRDIETLEAIDKIKKEKEMTSTSTTKKTTLHIIPSTTTEPSTTRTESTLTDTTTTTSTTRGTWRCGAEKQFILNDPPEECLDMVSDEVHRRKALALNGSDTYSDEISNNNKPFKGNKSDSNHTISRREGPDVENYGGICQNDHGGPLVALAGQQERLIGIALNSVYNKKYQCDGPSLYISTARAEALINCLIASPNENYYVPKRCKAMNFEVRKYNISWPECEDGDCETTTYRLIPAEQSGSVPEVQPVSPTPMVQPVSPAPMVQPVSPAPMVQPMQYNMGMPPVNIPPNLGLPLTPYIPPNQNPQYAYYSPQNYKIPPHYPYFKPPYKMGLSYNLQNYHMGMPHIPSYMGQPYKPPNYNMAKKPPYSWS